MALAVGARFGPYEMTGTLGAGGMGEVYRATDTNLKRAVAIKVLPESVATDRDRLARFQREAEVLASLNHPNIAHVYGLERSTGVTALVMELVEGPTLADRIAQGPIPIDEALAIAKQIAEALEAAHEQGIIHRDLKPANIKLRADGTVKVLDFGLAKALDPMAARGADATASPTVTSPVLMTGVGVLLGTAAYMSPEQARGKSVDKRTDIWAFGCVLYEMLTATRAFAGEDVTETLASVVKAEPAWGALPDSVSPSVKMFLRRCLQKNPKQRLQDIGDMRLALDGAFETTTPKAPPVAIPQWRRVALVGAAALIVGVVLTSTAVWYAMRPTPPLLVRTEISTSGASVLSINGIDRDLVITPDGSRIVYRGVDQLLVRALDQLTPTALTGLGAPRGPFISPDGQWVGFFDGASSVLKKVAITGGPAVTITKLDSSLGPRGATWGSDGTIVFATSKPNAGLLRVSAAGGEPTVLTTPNRESGQVYHVWPEFLPGGQAVLFTIAPVVGGNLDNAQIAVLDLRTNTQTVLVRGGSHAHYLPSGHLVYGAGGTLRAVAFDLARLAVVGTPVPVLEQVATTGVGAVDAAMAVNGTLVYVEGGVTSTQRSLVWVDRTGREEPLRAPPRAYVYAQLSPDGTRVAVDIRDQEQDVWVWDLARQTLQRLSFDPGLNRGPQWSPDGKRIAFSRALDSGEEVYWQAADGSGVPAALTEKSTRAMGPDDFSPDGMTLLYKPSAAPYDIWMIAVAGPRTAGMPLLNGPSNENNATVSPNGRWLAYQSDESGRYEIYVRPFPEVSTGRWQISTGGGTRPRWSRNGRELFYYVAAGPRGTLMAVSVESGSSFSAGAPEMLFQGSYPAPNAGRGLYDVSPDGQRFLMIKGDERSTAQNLTVVLNWHEELKRLVPTR